MGYERTCKSADNWVSSNMKTPMQCGFECRNEVAKKEGKNERECEFVDHGYTDGKRRGECYHEHGVTCDQSKEKMEEDDYSLYKIERIGKHYHLFF